MSACEFTKRPWPGYEYESILLEQWAAWVRTDCVIHNLNTGHGNGNKDFWMPESEVERAEKAMIAIDALSRKILKGWFLRCVVDYEPHVPPALREFSNALHSEHTYLPRVMVR